MIIKDKKIIEFQGMKEASLMWKRLLKLSKQNVSVVYLSNPHALFNWGFYESEILPDGYGNLDEFFEKEKEDWLFTIMGIEFKKGFINASPPNTRPSSK